MRHEGPDIGEEADGPLAQAALTPALPRRRLRALIEEAIVEAYGDSEQCIGFLTLQEEHLAVPFITEILGVAVRVDRVNRSDA